MTNRAFHPLTFTVALILGAFLGTQHPAATANAQGAKSVADQTWDDLASKDIAVQTGAMEAQLALARREQVRSTRQPVFDLVESYRAGTQNGETVKGLLSKSLNSYAFQKAGARGAVQASQAAAEAQLELAVVQIQQNQRIIGLLEELVKKK